MLSQKLARKTISKTAQRLILTRNNASNTNLNIAEFNLQDYAEHVADGVTFRWEFDQEVLVGVDATGWPVVLSDREFEITADYPLHAIVAGLEVNGLMENPYFGDGSNQGFSGFLGAVGSGSGDGAASSHTYNGALNKSVGKSGNFVVSVGDAKTLVKQAHLTSKTSLDGDWKTTAAWGRLTILATHPYEGFFSPAPSASNKAIIALTNQINKNVLHGGSLASGKPNLATALTGNSWADSIIPDFGQNGEQRRRYMAGLWSDIGYSRDYCKLWNDIVSAIHAQGTSADDTVVNQIIDYGLQLIGLLDRGYDHAGGAGQNSGHKQMVMLTAALLNSVDGLMAKALQVIGNATHQAVWVRNHMVGLGENSPQLGISAAYYNNFIFTDAHIGRPVFVSEVGNDIGEPEVPVGVSSDLLLNSNYDARYETVSWGPTFGELMNILMIRNVGGLDGSQLITRGEGFTSTNKWAACIAYLDRLRYLPNDWFDTSNRDAAEVAHYDAHRSSCAAPIWTGPPEDLTPFGTTSTDYLSSSGTTLSWDFSTWANSGESVLEGQVQISHASGADLYGIQWASVGGLAGSTVVAPGKYYVRLRRRSASGWGPWTTNPPKRTQEFAGPGDLEETMTITVGGTNSDVVVFTESPKIYKRTYPSWWGPAYTEVTSVGDIDDDFVLIGGTGIRTGNIGTAVFTWEEFNGSSWVTLENGQTLTSNKIALAGKTIRLSVTDGATTATSNSLEFDPPVYPAFTRVIFNNDATADFLSRTSAPSPPISDGRKLTLAISTEFLDGNSATRILYRAMDAAGTSSTDNIIDLNRTSANAVRLTVRNSTPGTVYDHTGNIPNWVAADGERLLMISIDLDAATYLWYYGNSPISLTGFSSGAGNINYSGIVRQVLYATIAGTALANVAHRYFFMHNDFIDLTVAGNRDKFLVANIEGDGSGPFGVSPAVFLYGPVENIATNYGTSGSFSITGSLENE